jgi:hypothetical protein
MFGDILGRGVSLWQSQLPSMDGTLNLGLFATRDFWPGQPLTYYEGYDNYFLFQEHIRD